MGRESEFDECMLYICAEILGNIIKGAFEIRSTKICGETLSLWLLKACTSYGVFWYVMKHENRIHIYAMFIAIAVYCQRGRMVNKEDFVWICNILFKIKPIGTSVSHALHCFVL